MPACPAGRLKTKFKQNIQVLPQICQKLWLKPIDSEFPFLHDLKVVAIHKKIFEQLMLIMRIVSFLQL